MCYVIYTGAGREKTAQRMIQKLVPHELYSRIFFPFRHMRKKIGGNWADIYEWLIPGYLFVITDRPSDLYTALRLVPRLTKLLGKNEDSPTSGFSPISSDEEAWLRALLGNKWFDHETESQKDYTEDEDFGALADISYIGFDENDSVCILSGPLMSFKGRVRHIDLHRRFAEVEVIFMGQPQLLRLGVEILAKSD